MNKKVSSKEKKSRDTRIVKSQKDLEQKELSGERQQDPSLAVSDTDEDEDEGIGDGNIHRRDDDPFSK